MNFSTIKNVDFAVLIFVDNQKVTRNTHASSANMQYHTISVELGSVHYVN